MFLDRFRILCIAAFTSIFLIFLTAYRSSHPQAHRGLKPGELLIVTASSGENGFLSIPGLKEMVYEDRTSYAHRWGYDHMWADMSSYGWGPKIYWNKIPIIKDALFRYPKAKWVWWLDMDIILMNHAINIYDHLLSPEGMMRNLQTNNTLNIPGGGDAGFRTTSHNDTSAVNFLIPTDNWGINVGSFLMRRSEWLDIVLDLWVDPLATSHDWIFPEQDGLLHLMQYHKYVRDHVGFLNQRSMNAYPDYNELGTHYEDGDLLVHFAGCGSTAECPEYWQDYWERRVNVNVPSFVKKHLENGTAAIENIKKDIY